ncbi:MAG: hypothetical protein U0174_05470 [Polyangiaceae bacterium]
MATKKPKAKTAAKGDGKAKAKAPAGKPAKTPQAKAGAKAAKPAKAEKGAKAAAKSAESSRRLGLRGAAPWAARHAAKHAAEARARAAEPPPPGSARATIRTPIGAEDIKQKIAALHVATTQIKTFRKNLAKGFFDIGLVLKEIQAKRLFEAKGFGSFDAFLEREMELGRTTSLRLVRVCAIFQREAALELGMEKVFSALSAIELGEGIPDARPSGKIPPPPISTSVLPLKPPGRS